MSRYYDSNTGRFISADGRMSGVSTSLDGFNLYAYCFNNPVMMTDGEGNWPRWITELVLIVATAVAAVASAPVVVTTATVVAGIAAGTWFLQTLHYDVRKDKNTNLPKSMQEAENLGWRNSDEISEQNPNGGGPSAKYHQYTSQDNSNVKYVSPDGKREIVFDRNDKIVNDPRDVGTYNFCPSGAFLGPWGHRFVDVLPWFIFGNDDDDPGPLINEIIKFFE